MQAGIYIHVPFCRRKCLYCSFYSAPSDAEEIQNYVDAVCGNIAFYQEDIPMDSIYFGGGTPSLLSVEQISHILEKIRVCFKISKDCEVTLEANPATLHDADYGGLLESGVNRISFGVQSLQDRQLKQLGRLHTASQAKESILTAYKEGFRNISCDVMLALPNQTSEELGDTLEQLAQLPIQHISAYLLKIEEGTPFAKANFTLPDEDMAADFYLQTVETLEQYGFHQYEISNFAKSGHESRHNTKYWKMAEYLGIGPSAHSLWHGKRFYVPSDLKQFCGEQPQKICDEETDLEFEKIMLGLRLNEGIPLEWLEGKEKVMQGFVEHDYMQVTGNQIAFTPKGFLVSNTILNLLLN